jgi:hypothetical protein
MTYNLSFKKMKTIITILSIIIFCFLAEDSFSQIFKLPKYYRESLNVDSIVKNTPDGLIFFPEIAIYPRNHPKNNRDRKRYDKLVNNFKKTYPFALEISQIYRNIDDSLSLFRTEKDKQNYLKVREKQIMNYYKPQLSNFTLSQGVLLVKLMDRESGSTAYEIVDELKGSVTAFFWQGFALMFGNNLKAEYDAKGDDKEIEYLVKRYRDGSL